MKSTAFGDRAKQLASWFQECNQCEQTIALYSLLTKVSATQARFFSLVLEHILKNGQDSQELAKMESDSNNPVFLSSIHSEPDKVALSRLLTHIPLLHPGNDKAREEYLKLLPKVLFGSLEDSEYLYQCRQLLSLALVHPAFPHEDREKLTFWLSRLEEKCRNIAERSVAGLYQGPLPPRAATLPLQNYFNSTSPPRRIYQINTGSSDDISNKRNGANRIYITMPQGTAPNLPFNFEEPEIDTYPSFEDDDEPNQKAFTIHSSGSSHHTTTTQEQHCCTPNNYDEYLKRNKIKFLSLPVNRPSSAFSLPANLDDEQVMPTFWKPGMKDIPVWLKSLRLHKYQQLFVDMSYEGLLGVTEDFLETKNVTKGARNKILQSIKKLNQRPETLAEIEQEVTKPGELLSCIHQLKQMLCTPIKPYPATADSNATSTATSTATSNATSTATATSATTSTTNSTATSNATSTVASTITVTKTDTESTKPITITEERKSPLSSNENSPGHLRIPIKDEASSGDSSCSTPPSSPRLRRSSSISSVDDLLAKEFPQEDLPSLMTKTIGKVFSQLMMHTETNEENLTMFIKLLDTAMCHEAFIVTHKKLFFEWKQQCQQTLRVISPKKSPRNKGWANAYTIAGNPPQPKVTLDRRSGRRGNNRGSTMSAKVPTSLMGSPRSSSTLPRASPRQFQQPYPPPYYPPPRCRSNSSGPLIKQQPIPIPAVLRTHRYVNMTVPSPMEEQSHMDELCKRITEHVVEDQGET